jgi:hypothetical protein
VDTIPVRDLPTLAPPAPSTTPATPTCSWRWVLPASALLVVAQLALRTWLIAGRSYYGDDLRILPLAHENPLHSLSYLTYDYDGHLMPGAFLVAGLVERAAPLEWWPAAVSLVVMQALASLTLLRLLRVLMGDRPALLVPLAFGLFTPIGLGSLTWWAASLNSLPLQIALAWFVAEAVLLARTGRRRHALSGTAALAFGLAFYLKAVLLPPIAFAVVVIVLIRDGARWPLVAALRRAWLLWAGTVVVVAGWAVTYFSTRQSDPTGDQANADTVVVLVRSGFKALAPSILGAPFRWDILLGGAPLGHSPAWSVTLAAVVLLIACVWTSVRLRGAWAVWALVVGTVAAGLLLAAAGRSGAGWSPLLPFAYRYFAAEVVLFPAALALLFSLRPRFPRSLEGPSGPRRSWGVALVSLLTVAFVAVAALSTVSHSRAWEGDTTSDYLETALASLAAAGPAPLLDQPVPGDVLWAQIAPANRLSRVFGPAEERPPIEAWTSELRMLDETGRLRPAAVVPGPRVLDGPVPDCGWAVGGTGTTVGLEGPLPDGEWTAELHYVAAAGGSVSVALGAGEPVRAPVTAGTATLYVRLSGDGPALQVTAAPGVGLCVSRGVVGSVAVP